MIRSHRASQGFTVTELLVSLGILAAILAISLASFIQLSRRDTLSATATALATALRDARARTLASVGGDQYGVKVDADRFTFFKGSAFASSTPGNETYLFSNSVKASSTVQTFVFRRVTGNAVSSGTISVFLATDQSTKKTVRVESTGLANIQ